MHERGGVSQVLIRSGLQESPGRTGMHDPIVNGFDVPLNNEFGFRACIEDCLKFPMEFPVQGIYRIGRIPRIGGMGHHGLVPLEIFCLSGHADNHGRIVIEMMGDDEAVLEIRHCLTGDPLGCDPF